VCGGGLALPVGVETGGCRLVGVLWVYWDDATGLVVVFNSGCGFAGGVVVDVLYAIITIYLCLFFLHNAF
jgi:hypothetical protein